MEQYRDTLFVLFVGFFILTGLASLAVVLGFVRKATPKFRDWAVVSFFASVIPPVVTLFQISFSPHIALFVTLDVSEEGLQPAALQRGIYEYDESDGKGGLTTKKGPIADIVLGNGGWVAKLPGDVIDKPLRLIFQDRDNVSWEVRTFWPNYLRQPMKKGSAQETVRGSTFRLPSLEPLAFAAEPGPAIKFNNYARPIGSKFDRPYYEWRVFVDEPREVLDTIRQVDYLLHPTFGDPLRISTDRARQFEHITSGWGSFTIVATVHYTNGKTAKANYYLDLNKNWPVESAIETKSRLAELEARLGQQLLQGYATYVAQNFARKYRVGVQSLTDAQKVALGGLWTETGAAVKTDAYMWLAVAGVGPVFTETEESKDLFAQIIDTAVQVVAGSNLGPSTAGKTPRERSESLAHVIKASPPSPTADAVNYIRTRALLNPAIRAKY